PTSPTGSTQSSELAASRRMTYRRMPSWTATQRASCATSQVQRFRMSDTTPLSDVVTSEAAARLTKDVTRSHGTDVVRVGVVGYGYWGPNVVRNLHSLDNCQLVAICDKSAEALRRASRV